MGSKNSCSIHAVFTGMCWVLKEDLTQQQLAQIKLQYTHINPYKPEELFSTYLELHGKVGVPLGDKAKIKNILGNITITDKRIAPEFSSKKSSKLSLRDYQEVALEEILEYIKAGGTEFNLSGRPGSGKSYMLANLLAVFNTKVLIIANQKMLINQLSKEIEDVLGEKPNVLNSKNTTIKDINVATSQFIAQNSKVWYEIKNQIGLLVLDEAESLASPTVTRIFQRAPAKFRILISATFTRSVDNRTGALTDFAGFKQVVLENKSLIIPTVVTVNCEEVFSIPKYNYVSHKIKFFERLSITNKVIDIVKYSISKNRQVLIACDIVSKQNELRDALNAIGIPSECLNGTTKDKDRLRILKDYEEGTLKVILGLGVLNAGLSLPKISTIIRLSTPSSEEKLEQLIGRGRRHFEGKDGCFIIDLVFRGFNVKKRQQFYAMKERTEKWKVFNVEWNTFKDKYLK